MEKSRPIFSIIIPTYNRAKKLLRALESIEKQVLQDFEVIVCDDGSTDNTKEVVNSFTNRLNIKYLWDKNWGGPARPRNNGLKAAIGEWICFLDSDDWWYPKKLEVSCKYLNNADIIYHPLDIYTPKGKKFLRKTPVRHLKKPVFLDLIRNGNTLANSSVVVKRSIINEVGGLSEDKSIVTLEDFDLWLRISKVADKFTCIPKTLGAYYWDGSNTTEVSERQIARVDALYSRYAELLSNEDREQMNAWVSCYKGSIKLNTSFLDEAFSLFKIALKSKKVEIKWMSIIGLISVIRRKLSHTIKRYTIFCHIMCVSIQLLTYA